MGKDSLLLKPIKVGHLTLKNRIMFPPQTTGYEERDGSIGERSFNFYKRIAQGGSSYVVIGDVAPVMTASPTPKLCDDRQIPTYKKLADMMHEYDCKVALQIFYPEYDVPGVGRLIMQSRMAMMEAQKAKEAGDMATFAAKMQESKEIGNSAYAKLHHDMLHFVTEATIEQLKTSIPMPTIPAVTYYWGPGETMVKNIWNSNASITEQQGVAEDSYAASKSQAEN